MLKKAAAMKDGEDWDKIAYWKVPQESTGFSHSKLCTTEVSVDHLTFYKLPEVEKKMARIYIVHNNHTYGREIRQDAWW